MKLLLLLALFVGCSFATLLAPTGYIGVRSGLIHGGGAYYAPGYYSSPYFYRGGYAGYPYASFGFRSLRYPYSRFYRY